MTGCSQQRSSGQLAGWGGEWARGRAEAGASFLPGGYLGEKGALRAIVLVAHGCRAESRSKKWLWGHVALSSIPGHPRLAP